MISRHRFPAVAAVLVAALVSGPRLSAAADTSKDVKVVNTPAESIPVTATGTVGLAAGTQVGISGPVSLAPGANVEVSNTPDSPLHVVAPEPVRVPFQRSVDFHFLDGTPSSIMSITVPAGKRLVVELIGGIVETAEGTQVDFAMSPVANGGGGTFYFPGVESRVTSGAFPRAYHFSASVRAYHDGGSPMYVAAFRPWLEPWGPATGRFVVSGYLVDRP